MVQTPKEVDYLWSIFQSNRNPATLLKSAYPYTGTLLLTKGMKKEKTLPYCASNTYETTNRLLWTLGITVAQKSQQNPIKHLKP